MQRFSRREFLKLATAGAALALALPPSAKASVGGRVVVIGGGFGGATCANYLRRYDPKLQITLIERNPRYVTCPFSNRVLTGLEPIESITHGYEGLAAKSIEVIHDRAVAIDPDARSIELAGGKRVPYDRLVLAPGISFVTDAIEGYDDSTAERMPHAWQAGPQTLLLQQQLSAMKDGGVVVIAVPRGPLRAPPAPFERASLIAHLLSEQKPKSKVLLLHPKEALAELELFQHLWKELYADRIEVIPADGIARVDSAKMTVFSTTGDAVRGEVINLIPPQRAGAIAIAANLTDEREWCPIDPATFASTRHPEIHVIGDACAAGSMPKTGHAANSQAKICAAAIVTGLRGDPLPPSPCSNSIYSFITPKYAVSTASVFRLSDGELREVSGGMSPKDAPRNQRSKEARYARGWYQSITADMFAT